MSTFDTYRANQFVAPEDETALSKIDKRIAAVCKKYNVRVAKSNAPGVLKSMEPIRSIMKTGGEAGVEFIIDVIQKSRWDNYSSGYSTAFTRTIGKIYTKKKNDPEELERAKEVLIDFLSTTSPLELVALGNNEFPSMTRDARITAVLNEIVDEEHRPVNEDTKRIEIKIA